MQVNLKPFLQTGDVVSKEIVKNTRFSRANTRVIKKKNPDATTLIHITQSTQTNKVWREKN